MNGQSGERPDYRLHCRRCGGTFVELAKLLFHPCGELAKPKRTRPRRRKKAVGGW